MLEVQLFLIFCVCFLIILINGIITAKSVDCYEKNGRTILIISVSKDSENLEYIIRNCIYKIAEGHLETMVILINFSNAHEQVYIFEKMMKNLCEYKIINV